MRPAWLDSRSHGPISMIRFRQDIELARTVALGFGGVAALSCLGALVGLSRSLRLRYRGELAEGEVVGHREESESTQVYPRVRFAANGAWVCIEGRTSVNARSRPLGQRVRIYYLPDEPGNGRIDASGGFYKVPLGLGVVCGLFALPAVLLALWADGWL